MPSDQEELALTLNAKKKKIKLQDFVSAMNNSGLEGKVIQNMFQRFRSAEEKWYDWIENSFLPQEMKTGYIGMIKERMNRLQ
jgi:serine/threonine-protein kinase HipA